MKEDSSTLPRRQKVRRSWTISSPTSNDKEGDWNRTHSSSVPTKPSRRKEHQDENIPPENSRERPKRRFSMSSIDSLPRRIKSPSRNRQERSSRGGSGNANREWQSPSRSSRQANVETRQTGRDAYHPNQPVSQHQKEWFQQQRDQHYSSRDVQQPYRDNMQQQIRHVHQPHKEFQHPIRDVPQFHRDMQSPNRRDMQSPSRDQPPPYRDTYYQNRELHQPRSRAPYQQNRNISPIGRGSPIRIIEKPEKRYFFGASNDPMDNRDARRSSTLPRQPRSGSRSNHILNEESEARFHSMPRTRSKTAQSHGIHPGSHAFETKSSEGDRFPERFSNGLPTERPYPNVKGITPVIPLKRELIRNWSESPPRQIRNYNIEKGYPHSQERLFASHSQGGHSQEKECHRNWPEIPPRQSRDFNTNRDFNKELVHKIYMEDECDLDNRMNLTTENEIIPVVHQVSVEDSSEMPYSKVSRSNTSASSGYTTLGHLGSSRNHMRIPVKRSHSFQPDSDSGSKFQKNNEPRGNVAKVVQSIEQGMKLNYNSVDHRTSGHDMAYYQDEPYSPESYQLPARIQCARNADLSDEDRGQTDIFPVLDSNKIMPDGDDYKLVFISSDSSKESEPNNSVEMDIGPADDFRRPFYEPTNGRQYSDAAVMTVDNSSADETSLLDVSMASSLCYPSDSHYDRSSVGTLTPMTTLDADEMGLIMQQTEVVQAEAQALQQALMSAFESESGTYPKTDAFTSNTVNEIINSKPFIRQVAKNCGSRKFSAGETCETDETKNIHHLGGTTDSPKIVTNKFVPQFTLKEKRNVAIQANLSIASSESDDSEQESYYDSSMMDSEDDMSQVGVQKCAHPDGMRNYAAYTANPDSIAIKNCLKEEGQNTFAPPSYLSGYPPNLPQISTPYNHLQLTLNRQDSVSVWPSVSEGCEVASLSSSNTNVNIHAGVNSEKSSDRKVSDVCTEASCTQRSYNENKSVLNTNSSQNDKKYNAFKAVNYAPVKIPLNNPPIFPKLSDIKMNSESKKEHSDINAVGKVISDPPKAQVHAPLRADEESPSSTSDEDTDEEKHVFRSYSINSSLANDNYKSSATSNTNTESDSDTQVSHCDNNTKTNNDSPVLCGTHAEVNTRTNDEQKAALCPPDDNEEVTSDSEMKLYLPECDQNIAEIPLAAYISESGENDVRTINKDCDAVSDLDTDPYDTSESIVENKSETESNIGIEGESLEHKDAESVKNTHEFAPENINEECAKVDRIDKLESKPSDLSSVSHQNDTKISEKNTDLIEISDNLADLSNDQVDNIELCSGNEETNKLINATILENITPENECQNDKIEANVNLAASENAHKSITREATATGSVELEQTITNCENEPVAVGNSSETGDTDTAIIVETESVSNINDKICHSVISDSVSECEEVCLDQNNIKKISENNQKPLCKEGESDLVNKYDGKENVYNVQLNDKASAKNRLQIDDDLVNIDKLKIDRRPIPPLRKAKRSSSSDGVSSSSDIERSDIDASDSADTIVENVTTNIFATKKSIQRNNKQVIAYHADSSQCRHESHSSDGSDEGNLVSIVAVGEDCSRRPQSQGKIYIRSNSTDSAVQIKPTCIVLTGDTSTESESDAESDHFIQPIENCDITVLDINKTPEKNHVMSFKVTSPESSRCPSPNKIRSAQESQQQYRSPIGQRGDSSSLANYFTVTLGSDSPALPRRANKTPEIRRRKTSDGIENADASSTPSQGHTPNHTPSPTLSHSPNNFEEHDPYYEDNSRQEIEDLNENTYDDYYSEDLIDSYGEQYSNNMKENDGHFDSIEEFESIEESNYSETSSEDSYDREEEIRYAKRSYNFALHTIIEESCEDSDYDKKEEAKAKHDQSELEKYFYFGLGNGPDEPKKYANEESEYSDTFSETSSSVYSEGVDSLDNEGVDPAELASSRLEKYFKDFLNFERQPSIRSVGEESEIHTDESGSVGSDSEGSPSPEQPRKKLFRSRGVRSVSSNRSHGYSSDKGEGVASDGSHHSGEQDEISEKTLVSGEDEGSTESEEIAFEKSDGQFDTIKRRKKKKGIIEASEKKHELEKTDAKLSINKSEENITKRIEQNSKDAKKSSDGVVSVTQNEKHSGKDYNLKQKEECFSGNDLAVRKYQSRDSGFIGSSDDLLKDKPEDSTKDLENKDPHSSDSSIEEKCGRNSERNSSVIKTNESLINKPIIEGSEDKSGNEGKVSRSSTGSSADLPTYGKNKEPQPSNLNRKDSFNNWSSDEETNIMMNKMRMFFKNMFSHTHSNNGNKEINKGLKIKSPQLMMFETKLTNLMRTVPGINDEQVKEIVEYLSSEDTWSDSYDSSDYTSSDLEGAYARLEQAVPELQSELQKQISVSCQQIIENFDQGGNQNDLESAQKMLAARSFIENNGDPSNKETFFMYHKIMSSITHAKQDSDRGSIGSGSQSTSPPLLAKVMHYIGNRLVALMHEVSVSSENGDDVDSFTGDNLVTSSPRQKLFLPKKYKNIDSVSLDSSVDKTSLTSTSFESEDSPTDTENSPESEIGTPKAGRHNRLSVISEKSSIEDFHSSEQQKLITSPSESVRYNQYKKSTSSYMPHKILEERGNTDSRGKDFEAWRRSAADDRIDVREQGGVSKALSRSGKRADTRKARSHMSLEKIHQEDVKNTGERSESLGDLLDRVKSSGFSSSYEQLDSDSTLRASDSLDRQIGSSSSNIRLNASSRGSLNTSSRGSLAASSRGSLNASSRGSLQGSSGPDEDEDKKSKKATSFFRHARRSATLDEAKEPFLREIRSTTLPRSTPAQILSTGTLPRSNQPPSQLFSNKLHSGSQGAERNPPSTSTGPRSARYHPPGYRQPSNSNLLPKRTISTPILKKDKTWHTQDDTRSYANDASSVSMSVGSLPKASLPNSTTGSLRGGVGSSNSSRTASPLGGSLGRASAGSLASFDNLPNEEAKRTRLGEYRRNNSLSTLGLKSRSDSMASVCSNGGEGRYGSVSVMGEVRFGLQYNYKEGQLECHVVGCRDLAPVDTRRNRSDPYVKAYLLPDKSKAGKKKTKVKRHTLSPVFEEILKFQTTLSDLESRTLWLSVWHYGLFGKNDFLGEVLLRLDDSVLEDSSMKWYSLQDRTEVMEEGNYGAILIIALKFVPPDALAISGIKPSSGKRRSRGALQVRIKEATGLVGVKTPQNPPDPICKGVLLPEKGKSSKQKTSVCRKTSNPHWNHTMNFDDVTLQELTERSLELSILDHDRFGSSEFMGGCRLNLGNSKAIEDGMDASGLEQKLWEQMLERPNLWVESSLLLRSILDRPIYSSNFTE